MRCHPAKVLQRVRYKLNINASRGNIIQHFSEDFTITKQIYIDMIIGIEICICRVPI